MEDFTGHINRARGRKDMSIREMGRLAGISPGYAQQIANGTIPDDPVIRKLCAVLDLDEMEMKFLALIEKQQDQEDKDLYDSILRFRNWLVHLPASTDHTVYENILQALNKYDINENIKKVWQNVFGKSLQEIQTSIQFSEVDTDINPFQHNQKTLQRIPVFDAQGGISGAWTDGGYPVGEASDFEWLPSHLVDENSFIVIIHGDSMAPALPEGSRALVVPSRPLEPGKLCFAAFPGDDGDRMIKRYYQYGDTVVLKSDNPAFPDITLDANNGKGVKLYRVTWTRE
jgi:SOS-response transcriptional repressor LexA